MYTRFRTITKWSWVCTIIVCLTFYLYQPNTFSKENIAMFIGEYKNQAWLVYFLIHIFRGFVLLPSTPLVFAGLILFPEHPFWILIISLVGIVTCSILIYFFSKKLGLYSVFEKQKKKLNFIESKLKGEHSFLFIFVWSLAPFVPTDLICYASGALKIRPVIFITSLLMGELILCSIYIFGSTFIIN